MKKLATALLAASCLIACGNAQKSEQQAAETESSSSTAAVTAEDQIVPDVPKESTVFENDIYKFNLGTGELVAKGVHYDMAYVTAGTFTMGAAADDADAADDEKPAHKVTLTHDYYIGKTPVTVGFWKAVMGSAPADHEDIPDNSAVQNVSWEQCAEFISVLSQHCGELEEWALPTEAEWEFAARGGNKSKGYKYSGSNNPDEVAWYNDSYSNRAEDAFEGSYPPVALKKPNELGIYDMSGSVYEWCRDQYTAYTDEAQEDPSCYDFEATTDIRVKRGGARLYRARLCRVTSRNYESATADFNPLTGFRLVYKHYQQEDGEEE